MWRSANALMGFHLSLPSRWQDDLLLLTDFLHIGRTVDPEGFEPSTFSMPLRRAPNCAMGPDDRICSGYNSSAILTAIGSFVNQSATRKVDLRGFEPLTSSVRLRRAPNCATGP